MLLTVSKDKLVDVPMKCTIRQTRQLADAREVVVLLVIEFAESGEVVVTVGESQDTSAASMKPIAWVLLGVTFDQTCSNGIGGANMV